tara:strand:- start:2025 stop:2645 length:621 start_codon:yes stop_codon:yes gene_type:complete
LTLSNDYLDDNLITKINSIEPSDNSSHILAALGYENLVSQQSFVIQLGNQLETFWEETIALSTSTKSYVPPGKKLYIKVDGSNRQIDHLFELQKEPDRLYYLESKANLDFDTEKDPASKEKIISVAKAIELEFKKKVIFSYFVPIIRKPTNEMQKYKDIDINGVDWLIKKIECKLFTSEEFFNKLETDAHEIFKEKVVSRYLKDTQ